MTGWRPTPPKDRVTAELSARAAGVRLVVHGDTGLAGALPEAMASADEFEKQSVAMHEAQVCLPPLEAKEDEKMFMKRLPTKQREISTISTVKVGRNPPADFAPGVVHVDGSSRPRLTSKIASLPRERNADDGTQKMPTPAVSSRPITRK